VPIKIISLSLPNGEPVIKVLPETKKRREKTTSPNLTASNPRDKDSEIKGEN